MSRIRFALLLAVLSLGLAGCSARGQAFHPSLITASGGNSTIIVYRLSQFTGKAYTADIVLDGQPMGELKNGGFITAAVPPGPHVVEIDKSILETGGRYPTAINAEPGRAYFVRYDQRAVPPLPVVLDGFSIVPPDQAVQELRELRESR